MEGKKKILTISFEGRTPTQASAAWDGEKLFILEVNDINGNPHFWMDSVLEDIENKAKSGWVIMVDDSTASFPPPATSWNMNSLGEDGRTNLQTALEWYFALQSRGEIIFEPHLKQYQIRLGGDNDMAFAEHDERGRRIYRIDWTKFNSRHMALLMCVAGAVMEEPLSDRWMKVFAGTLPGVKEPPIWPVFRTMKNLWKKQQEEIEAKVAELEARKNVQH